MVSRSDSRPDIAIAGDRAVVRIPAPNFGAVDEEPADERLLSLLGQTDRKVLALDFANVNFVSSIGLAVLLRLRKQLAANGRRLAVLNVRPEVYEVFSVTKLTTVFDVQQQEAA
jgi:anti-anti-sigma factor